MPYGRNLNDLVMNSNIFQIQRLEILDYFIIPFIENDYGIGYITSVSLPFEWSLLGKKGSIIKIEESDYEKTLKNYFENTNNINNNHPILLIIGDVGTGKSATLRLAFFRANVCEGCPIYSNCLRNYPSKTLVDFIKFKAVFEEGISNEHVSVNKQELENRFWTYIINLLDKILDSEISQNFEISTFWEWWINEHTKSIPIRLYRLLFMKKELFSNPKSNRRELLELKNRFFQEIDTQELAYYKLYQISFLRKDLSVNCNFIIFDNIDILDPFLQNSLIEFSLSANELLSCKIVIPLQSHTPFLNSVENYRFEVIQHWSPSLKRVFEERLKYFKIHGSEEVYEALLKINKLVNNNSIFNEVLISTSGNNIRRGLRNFYNFLLSPLLITQRNEVPLSNISLNASSFFQAYFCSETRDQFLDEDNFINLFSIRKSKKESYFSNIKLRMLHLVYLNENILLGDLVDILKNFGYDKQEIITALNDFLNSRKTMIYSSALNSYAKGDIKKGVFHVIHITQLGINYFNIVLKHSLYIKECIMSVDRTRLRLKELCINRTIEVLKEMEYMDYKEIEIFLLKKGVVEYNNLYSFEQLSIHNLLWEKIKDSFEYWVSGTNSISFDYERQNYIKGSVISLLTKYGLKDIDFKTI